MLKKYTMKYLGVKDYDVHNLPSDNSEKNIYVYVFYIYM